MPFCVTADLPPNIGMGALPPVDLPNRGLTVAEVATYFNVCQATVRREIKRGRLRASRAASAWRIMPGDVVTYLHGDDLSGGAA